MSSQQDRNTPQEQRWMIARLRAIFAMVFLVSCAGVLLGTYGCNGEGPCCPTIEEFQSAGIICEEQGFAADSRLLRSALTIPADPAEDLDVEAAALSPKVAPILRSEILRRFHQDGDSSRFGLVNAVTSVARDKRDWGLRWRLEQLGGAILVRLARKPVLVEHACGSSLPGE